MKKSRVISWAIVIIMGFWMGVSAIQALDEAAAKAQSRLSIEERLR